MKVLLMVAVLIVIVDHAYGQFSGLQGLRRRRSEASFKRENPSGTNRWGRAFNEQNEYEETFHLKSFMGFEFGESVKKYATNTNNSIASKVLVKLEKPFRLFEEVILAPTVKGNLCGLMFSNSTQNISRESLEKEKTKIYSLLEKKFTVRINQFGSFANRNVRINVLVSYDTETGDGTLMLVVDNHKQHKDDYTSYLKEKAKNEKDLNIADDVGWDMISGSEAVSIPKPVVVRNTKSRSSMNQRNQRKEHESVAPPRMKKLNKFNRTDRQQKQYEEDFTLKSFLGYEFGESVDKYPNNGTNSLASTRYAIELKKPFRMFKGGWLETVEGSKGNAIVSVVLWVDKDKSISEESYTLEMDAIVKLLKDKYQIVIGGVDGDSAWSFFNKHIYITIDKDTWSRRRGLWYENTGFTIKVTNKDIESEEKSQAAKIGKTLKFSSSEGADLL